MESNQEPDPKHKKKSYPAKKKSVKKKSAKAKRSHTSNPHDRRAPQLRSPRPQIQNDDSSSEHKSAMLWSERGFEWQTGRFLPWHELQFSSDTSGGPGGQHANRSQTRISLSWRLTSSEAFSRHEINMLRNFLQTQLSRSGVLRIRCGSERSAARNREICVERLSALLRDGLRARKPRVSSKPSKSSKRRRMDTKNRRSKIKENRQRPKFD